MRKSFGLFVLLMMCISPALAQENAPAPQDQSAASQEAPQKPKERVTPKYELSAGYAYRSYYQPNISTIWMNGWYASFDYSLMHWLGVEAEGMGVYKDQGIILGKTRIYHLLVGPKLYPLGHRKVTPFGHFLVGGARYSNTTPPYGGYPSNNKTASAYAWEAGGGLDWNLSRHWGVRLFQFDFGHENFFGGPTGTTHISRRIAAGFVYRFGEK
jgi:opacity protein-like surface antigen